MRIILGLSLLLTVILYVSPTRAARSALQSIGDLTQKADCVIHGTVEGLTSRRDGNGKQLTEVDLLIRETWKGTQQNRMIIATAGGTLGDRKVLIPGQAEFRIGEEVVLFVVTNVLGQGIVVELSQGKFEVNTSTNGSQVSNGVWGNSSPSIAPSALQYRMPTPRRFSLDDLKQQVALESPH